MYQLLDGIIERVDAETGIPSLVFRDRKKGKKPAVIAVAGYSGCKERMLGLCCRLAREGFLVVTFDPPRHGDRQDADVMKDSQRNFPKVLTQIVTKNSLEIRKVIDYLNERNDVRRGKYGITGISMGGYITLFAGRLYKELKVLVPIIGGGNLPANFKKATFMRRMKFKKDLKAQINGHVRGLLRKYDPVYHPDEYFPKEILIMEGKKDDIVVADSTSGMYRMLKPYYRKNPAKLKLLSCRDCGHECSSEMMNELTKWFKKYL